MFVFFKQKTAYDMRISDWSSDVCSSDLAPRGKVARRLVERELRDRRRQPRHQIPRRLVMRTARKDDEARPARRRRSDAIGSRVHGGAPIVLQCRREALLHVADRPRAREEEAEMAAPEFGPDIGNLRHRDLGRELLIE